MATITAAQLQQIRQSVSSSSSANVNEVSALEARLVGNHCNVLLIENKVFPLESGNQLRMMSSFNQVDLGELIREVESLDLLAFVVFAAIESNNPNVLSYIKAQRPHTFIPALKIAVERARLTNREVFFDVLFSPNFKDHLTSESLASLLRSPHNPNLSLFVLDQMNVGFFKEKHILAAVQSAVDWAEYSPQTEAYLTALLNSAHNTCKDADYVKIFTDSCVENNPDNGTGLRALLSRLSSQGVTDVFCSVVNMHPSIVQKALPIIFEERGQNMDTQAVIEHIDHGDALVLSAAKNTPIWNRIPHLEPASSNIVVVEA